MIDAVNVPVQSVAANGSVTNTASMVGMQNDENFFLSLACDFINDPDAKPFKVEKYFLD